MRQHFLLRSPTQMVKPAVPEVQENIPKHHDSVQDIQAYHHIGAEKYFMQNAGDISQKNHPQKKKALAGIGPGAVRAAEGKRPGRPKARQHDNLKNTHGSSTRLSA